MGLQICSGLTHFTSYEKFKYSKQFSSFLSFKLYVRINLQNQMQNMHRQIFPLSILDTLFLLGQQVLKILKSLLDVTPTTIHITDCIVATFVVEAIKLRLKLFLFTASKTQRPGKTKQPSGQYFICKKDPIQGHLIEYIWSSM